jgi:hypothetical protein
MRELYSHFDGGIISDDTDHAKEPGTLHGYWRPNDGNFDRSVVVTNHNRANGSINSVDGDVKMRSRLISTVKRMRHRPRKIINCDSLNQTSMIIKERHLKVSPICFSPRNRGLYAAGNGRGEPFQDDLGIHNLEGVVFRQVDSWCWLGVDKLNSREERYEELKETAHICVNGHLAAESYAESK